MGSESYQVFEDRGKLEKVSALRLAELRFRLTEPGLVIRSQRISGSPAPIAAAMSSLRWALVAALGPLGRWLLGCRGRE